MKSVLRTNATEGMVECQNVYLGSEDFQLPGIYSINGILIIMKLL
jgi:hypothetical protein